MQEEEFNHNNITGHSDVHVVISDHQSEMVISMWIGREAKLPRNQTSGLS